MVSYFYRNKGRKELNPCEDSLTAVVFDTLKYLPTNLFWTILKSSLYQDKLPFISGELDAITFWDIWNATDTSNSKFVEPDVFLRFNKFDVIVEAKRFDTKQQNDSQITNEIQSYLNEYSEDKKELYVIKLGGLHSKENEKKHKLHDAIICKTDWTKLLDVISKTLSDLIKESNPINNSYIRILEDCIQGFALHQYYKKEWLSEICQIKITTHVSFKNTFNYVK